MNHEGHKGHEEMLFESYFVSFLTFVSFVVKGFKE